MFTLGFGWAALESGAYHMRVRRQLLLGLIDPVVANRLLLWTIASGAAFLLGVCLLVLQLGHAQLIGSLLPSLLIMTVSLVTGTATYLTYLPPHAYLCWVRARVGANA